MLGLLGVYILLYSLFSAVILCGSSSLLGLPRCLCGSLRLFSQTVDNLGGVVLSRLKSPYIAGGCVKNTLSSPVALPPGRGSVWRGLSRIVCGSRLLPGPYCSLTRAVVGDYAREYLRGLSAAAGLLVGAPCRKLGGLRAGSPAAAAALPPLARGAGSVRAVPPDPVDLVAPPLLLAAIS